MQCPFEFPHSPLTGSRCPYPHFPPTHHSTLAVYSRITHPHAKHWPILLTHFNSLISKQKLKIISRRMHLHISNIYMFTLLIWTTNPYLLIVTHNTTLSLTLDPDYHTILTHKHSLTHPPIKRFRKRAYPTHQPSLTFTSHTHCNESHSFSLYFSYWPAHHSRGLTNFPNLFLLMTNSPLTYCRWLAIQQLFTMLTNRFAYLTICTLNILAPKSNPLNVSKKSIF